MTRFANPAIHGEKPWGRAAASLDETPKDAAERKNISYWCPLGHERVIPLCRGVQPPDACECTCGLTGRREGVPDDAEPEWPKYTQGTGGVPKSRAGQDVTPMAQLWKRRTRADLEKLLAERVAEVRAERGVA